MKSVSVLLTIVLGGCFYFGKDQYEDILTKPSSEWDSRECLTVIASPMANNLFDFRTNIKVMVTPYYPSVILALQRNAQKLNHWSEEEYRSNVDELMRENIGMYVDWTSNRFVDGRGNYFKNITQIDSLMFLITLNNKAWPCNSMMNIFIGGGDIYSPNWAGKVVTMPVVGFDNCYIPDIVHLEEKIFLINEKINSSSRNMYGEGSITS